MSEPDRTDEPERDVPGPHRWRLGIIASLVTVIAIGYVIYTLATLSPPHYPAPGLGV